MEPYVIISQSKVLSTPDKKHEMGKEAQLVNGYVKELLHALLKVNQTCTTYRAKISTGNSSPSSNILKHTIECENLNMQLLLASRLGDFRKSTFLDVYNTGTYTV